MSENWFNSYMKIEIFIRITLHNASCINGISISPVLRKTGFHISEIWEDCIILVTWVKHFDYPLFNNGLF
jgi:hypothetical protein